MGERFRSPETIADELRLRRTMPDVACTMPTMLKADSRRSQTSVARARRVGNRSGIVEYFSGSRARSSDLLLADIVAGIKSIDDVDERKISRKTA